MGSREGQQTRELPLVNSVETSINLEGERVKKMREGASLFPSYEAKREMRSRAFCLRLWNTIMKIIAINIIIAIGA
jgi:hypothetical protein